MTMMTAAQYEESLRKLNLIVYMFGERLTNVVDDPIIRPSMQAVAKTYELAHMPEHEDLMTAISHLTGKRINLVDWQIHDLAPTQHSQGSCTNNELFNIVAAAACDHFQVKN